jgi:hypothetical protein
MMRALGALIRRPARCEIVYVLVSASDEIVVAVIILVKVPEARNRTSAVISAVEAAVTGLGLTRLQLGLGGKAERVVVCGCR